MGVGGLLDYGQSGVISRPGWGGHSHKVKSGHNICTMYHNTLKLDLQQHCKTFNHQESHNSS